jgi:hypothetical protein
MSEYKLEKIDQETSDMLNEASIAAVETVAAIVNDNGGIGESALILALVRVGADPDMVSKQMKTFFKFLQEAKQHEETKQEN